MTEIDREWWYKNDKEMTGVLYGGVQKFCLGTNIIITTLRDCVFNETRWRTHTFHRYLKFQPGLKLVM